MSRTPTLPPTDKSMWRKLIARAHPDTGGDHELFIWTRAAMEAICSSFTAPEQQASPGPRPESHPRREWPSAEEADRVPFDREASFAELTRRAVAMVDGEPLAYARLLRLLYDCHPSPMHEVQQQRGGTYRQLAAAGHLVGMDKRERVGWYRLAESIPLSDRHAGHILSRLKEKS